MDVEDFPPMVVWKIAHTAGHRKSHFKRTQYWKHSSVRQPRNAVEPLESNKYVALNGQTHEALIFKPFFPTKEPETRFSREKGLPVTKLMPWSSSVFVFVVFTKAVCHLDTQLTAL